MKNLFTQTPEVPETNFPVTLAKGAAVSAASVVGMVGGLALAGAVKMKLDARKARKNDSTETPTE